MKKHLPTIALVLVFLTGLGLLLYPSVSDYWNSLHQSRAIASYVEATVSMDNSAYEEAREQAVAYNEKLATQPQRYMLTEEETEVYNGLLDLGGTGIMAYIEIPRIKCELPIYHGTNADVLQIAVGHVAGSSLPVGGESTHCVLSAHRGLPSAKLFTNLDQLVEGDVFILQTLGDTLTYEVDRILIVLPEEIEALQIEAGEDYCTLVTCTPYGVNSHRLLVRGHRIETQAEPGAVRVTADAMQIEPIIVAPIVASVMLLLLLFGLLAFGKRGRK